MLFRQKSFCLASLIFPDAGKFLKCVTVGRDQTSIATGGPHNLGYVEIAM
jgi:hypothetical protein